MKILKNALLATSGIVIVFAVSYCTLILNNLYIQKIGTDINTAMNQELQKQLPQLCENLNKQNTQVQSGSIK